MKKYNKATNISENILNIQSQHFCKTNLLFLRNKKFKGCKYEIN